MADDLHENSVVSDATWAVLSKKYSTEQLMDAVFTVGQYNLVSWALNSFGVPLDDFLPGSALRPAFKRKVGEEPEATARNPPRRARRSCASIGAGD